MSDPEFDGYKAVFADFTSRYLHSHTGDCAGLIQLKIDHSLRVLAEAESILASEGVPQEHARLCRLAALFHDAGRFPQLDRFGTFSDAQSVNHARLGVQTIKREGLLSALSPQDRKTVLTAIVLHNVRLLPRGLSPAAGRAARVVRDADKLDIIPVILASLDGAGHSNKVVTLNTKSAPDKFSAAIARQLSNRELADYARMEYSNDFRLLLLSWVYDLNHAHSARMFLERDYIDRLVEGLPDTAEMAAIAGQVKKDALTISKGKSLAKKRLTP